MLFIVFSGVNDGRAEGSLSAEKDTNELEKEAVKQLIEGKKVCVVVMHVYYFLE